MKLHSVKWKLLLDGCTINITKCADSGTRGVDMGVVKGDREEGVGEEGEVCSVGTFHEGEGGVGGTWDEGEDRNVAA